MGIFGQIFHQEFHRQLEEQDQELGTVSRETLVHPGRQQRVELELADRVDLGPEPVAFGDFLRVRLDSLGEEFSGVSQRVFPHERGPQNQELLVEKVQFVLRILQIVGEVEDPVDLAFQVDHEEGLRLAALKNLDQCLLVAKIGLGRGKLGKRELVHWLIVYLEKTGFAEPDAKGEGGQLGFGRYEHLSVIDLVKII